MNSLMHRLLHFSGCTFKRLFRTFQCRNWCVHDLSKGSDPLPLYICGQDSQTLQTVNDSFKLYLDFLSEAEEQSLMTEIELVLRRRRYEYDHWDGAIHGYRETERANWNPGNEIILNRVRDFAFPAGDNHLPHVHVLDLADKGLIKPHIDSVKFCGNTIAGLSLLSSCVMRLVNDANKSLFVDIYLQRRSLYIMTGAARYNFTHEVLEQKDSYFNGVQIPRGRRVSVIFRNVPPEEKP